MKKLINILFLTAIIFSTSCENDIDNYDAPNGGIRGTIYDIETNEPIPLPVQGTAGVLVNLYEQNTNATQSVDFRAKQDGTFENSQIFNCEYKVVVNGPFVDKCEGVVSVNGATQFDLKATPYSRINIEASVDDNNQVSITYIVNKTNPSYTVSEVSFLWNFAPGVDINSSNYATRVNAKLVSGTHVFDLPKDSKFTENYYKIKSNKNKIYVRVAAKAQGIVNYSKIIELTVKDIK